MEKNSENEERKKDLIFDIFLKYQNALHSDRRQVYFLQFCEQVFKWYKDYFFGNVDNVGVEIFDAINRITKAGKITAIPKDRAGFFRYLITVLKNVEVEYYRKYGSDAIYIPKEQKSRLKAVEAIIERQESDLGRKLTNEERSLYISERFKNEEYVDIKKAMAIGSLFGYIDADGEIDLLDSSAMRPIKGSSSNNPLDEYIYNESKREILEAVQFLLDKKQERSKPCYKSLFTLHCIIKLKDFEFLYPVLDGEILKNWQKDGERPRQYEIYQKHHPNASKNGAEAIAAKMLREFLSNLEAHFN